VLLRVVGTVTAPHVDDARAIRVAEGDRVVVSVGVTVERLRIVGRQEGVEAEEAASDGVVFAGSYMGKAVPRQTLWQSLFLAGSVV
jgi:hypothetical protein